MKGESSGRRQGVDRRNRGLNEVVAKEIDDKFEEVPSAVAVQVLPTTVEPCSDSVAR